MLSTIGIIIDVAIILGVVISSIIGYRKGLLKSVLSIFSWIVCLLIAIFTAKYVAGWLNGLYDFSALVGSKISKTLIGSNEYFSRAINSFANKEEIIASLESVNTNGLLKQLIKAVFSASTVDMTSEVSVGSFLGDCLGDVSIVVIAGVLVFIILKTVVTILSKLFDKIDKTVILGGLNKLLGLALGLLRAGIIIVGINVILVTSSLIPASNKLINTVVKENTHVEKVIYNKTDKLFGKYVIEGDTVKNWIEDLWAKR